MSHNIWYDSMSGADAGFSLKKGRGRLWSDCYAKAELENFGAKLISTSRPFFDKFQSLQPKKEVTQSSCSQAHVEDLHTGHEKAVRRIIFKERYRKKGADTYACDHALKSLADWCCR